MPPKNRIAGPRVQQIQILTGMRKYIYIYIYILANVYRNNGIMENLYILKAS